MLSENETETWAERSEHWKSDHETRKISRLKRARRTAPLILCGHGVSLKVQNGALFIQDGISHADGEPKQWRFYPGELDIPERIILVECSGAVTLAALRWLGEQQATLIDLSWRGDVVSVIGGSGVAVEPEKLQWQIETRSDADARLEFGCDIIRQKLQASLETIEAALPDGRLKQSAIDWTNKCIGQIEQNTAENVQALLGIEGVAAAKYFAVWDGLELKWKAVNRYPVPKPWLRYSQRSSTLSGKKPKNYGADHPINAMLNYGYAWLESQTRIKLVSEGYDPSYGIYHEMRDGASSYVFDMMEPLRPKVDRVVLEFAQSQTFSVKDFDVQKDGVCRLGPELARGLVAVLRA